MPRANDQRLMTNDETLHKLCHRRGLFARIACNRFHDRGADNTGIRELSNCSELLGIRNSEADSDREFRMFS